MQVQFPLILDGATGTQLQKRGYTGGQCTEQWVLEHPEAMIDLQSKYIEVGSHVVYAGTFSANRVKLEENGIFNQVTEYNKKLVAISKQAAQGKAWVAGDIAPTGKFLAPMGDTSFEELVEIYTEQAKAMEEAGVDLFVIETMMTVSDARAALLAVKSVSRKPVMVTFTCNPEGKTLMGSDIAAVLQILQGMGVDAFGLNCSVGPEDMLRQIRRLSEYAQVPLIAKPNAGMPQIVDGKTVYHCPPEEFSAYVQEMAACGVAIFGGCCGTEPEHIAALTEKTAKCAIARPKGGDANLLPLATEKKLALLPRDTAVESVLPCNDELAEALEAALENRETLVSIRIESREELSNFADCQYAITKPLCLLCEDAQVLEQALRLYQGRAMYEGNLSEDVLKQLSRKYGLVY